MHHHAFRLVLRAGALAALALLLGPEQARGAGQGIPREQRCCFSTKLKAYAPKTYPDHGTKDTMTEQGRRARGFYITAYYMGRAGAERAAEMMKRARMNAVVIDVKDDWGHIVWPSAVPLSKKVQQIYIRDPRAAIRTFHEHGIYVIARFVCFKDSRLPLVRPDLSVRFQPHGRSLFSAGAGWLDAYAAEVQDYLIDLALEWQSYGVDEVQLDYIRFPKGHTGTLGLWLHQGEDKRPRDQVISDFLERVDRALTIPISVDVFGLTTLVDGDPRGLGQTIEVMARHAEAISPMMYANGMTSYFRNQTITERVYNLIQCGLWRARQKAPPEVVIRPYLQAYPSSVPFFGPDFIRRQVEAAGQAGAEGFLFWNASMRNGVAYRALQRMGDQLDQLGRKPADADSDHAPPATAKVSDPPGSWCRAAGKGHVFVGGG